MSAVHITEAELARDVRAVLDQVEQGAEIIIDRDHRPVAVIKASRPAGRRFSEVLAALEANGAHAVLDEDFEWDVKASTGTWHEPWNPPSSE